MGGDVSCSSCARIRRRIRELADKARAATLAARRSLKPKRTGLTGRKLHVD